ncbi:hypothetical protein [Streptomyces tsukubensis]|uniref:hypothetical protein n=1 Tax=Streptomyces tsukubensis TaxID=83656 RepID=UPI00344C7D7D
MALAMNAIRAQDQRHVDRASRDCTERILLHVLFDLPGSGLEPGTNTHALPQGTALPFSNAERVISGGPLIRYPRQPSLY